MKTILICAALLIAIVYAADELPSDFKAKLTAKVQEVGTKCVAKEKATGEDIAELLARRPPSRKAGKCVIACINQEFGSQDTDGKLSEEGAIKSVEPFKAANEGIYNKIVNILKECFPEVKASDRCEIAAEMAHCMHTKAAAAGLTPDMLM